MKKVLSVFVVFIFMLFVTQFYIPKQPYLCVEKTEFEELKENKTPKKKHKK